MIWILLAVVVWFGFGLLAWGFSCGAHNNAFYNWCNPNTISTFVLCLFGPCTFFSVAMVDGFDNWAWKPLSRQERWEIYKKKFPLLVERGRTTFENFER